MHGEDWTFQRSRDEDGGTSGVDDEFFARRYLNVGAWIFGRNMFGPVRGPCLDSSITIFSSPSSGCAYG